MIMPKKIEGYLFSPCGMNCMVCYAHLKDKKACPGCLGSEENKPDRCKKCEIKSCASGKNITYCFECKEFPCKSISNLEKSYVKRYKTSLIENSNHAKALGIAEFQKRERKKWLCKGCNGVISIHDGICSECKKEIQRTP
jgi:hypothetical protein